MSCNHDWKICRVGEYSHQCSKCGRYGKSVLRFDRKTGTDRWVMRAENRK